MAEVYVEDTDQGLKSAVNKIFNQIEKSGESILKKSKKVYIKVNGIDFKKHTHTSPEILEAVILYLKEKGADVYVIENSTQANLTRLVFTITGYKEICEKNRVNIIYLDEEETQIFEFCGKPSIEVDSEGYNLVNFRLPKTIVKIMENRESLTYINIPKLKTHSMAGVTLSIKNQWGFPQHADRGKDHNYNLHSKLIDLYELIQPDISLIDGTEGTINGHYPPTAWKDKCVIPFKILIGGTDPIAVDVVGARIFGLTIEEIPHLKIAYKRGLGEGDLNKIKVIGKDLREYNKKYDWNLLQKFPEDVKIIKGNVLLCKEGCQNNSLTVLQSFAYDFPNKFNGGWFIIMGKGHEENLIEKLKAEGYNKGLVVGYCAIDEVGKKLRKEFGRKNIFYSGDCNNLAETVTAELKLAGMNVFDIIPYEYDKIMQILEEAQKNGTKALIATAF